MPEEEKKNEPMVDIDTSGPEVEVNLEEETKQEEPKETIKVEETEPKQEIEVIEETKKPEVKEETEDKKNELEEYCLLYTSPSPRDNGRSRMQSSA